METPLELDHFKILTHPDGKPWELGRGAMGVTYKGWNTSLECLVAIKVINPQILGKVDIRRRFLNEAKAAAKLQHPNIATVHHLGETAGGTAYYVMEYCDGVTVHEAVMQNGALDAAGALAIVLQIAKALTIAEKNSIVHRDLKPANLMLVNRADENLWVKVIDFGLACRYDADPEDSLATIGSGLSGTICYASPEQLQELEVDIRSDFYGLGACLWFMLRRENLFKGAQALVMANTLKTEPPFEQLAGLPQPVVSLMRRLLAKEPRDRPRSALVLCNEIERCLQSVSAALRSGHEAEASVRQQNNPAAKGDSGDLIFGKYSVEEVLFKTPMHTVLRGVEKDTASAVLIHVLSPALGNVPSVIREAELHFAQLRSFPHPNLCRVVEFGRQSEGWTVVSTPANFLSFVQILKMRSALRPGEVVQLLQPVADILDFASMTPLKKLQIGLSDLWVVQEGKIEASLFDRPVSEWPAHTVVVNALGLNRLLVPTVDIQLSTLPTMSPGMDGSEAEMIPPALQVARLFHELVGGGGSKKGRFGPVSRLSEGANSLLAEVQSGMTIKAVELIEQIQKSLEKEFLPTEEIPVPQKPEVKSANWVRLALLVPVGLVLGWILLTYYRNSHADDPRAWDYSVATMESIQRQRDSIQTITDEITRNLKLANAAASQKDVSQDVIDDFQTAIDLANQRIAQSCQHVDRMQSELTDAWAAYPESYEEVMHAIVEMPPEQRNHKIEGLARAFLKRFKDLDSGSNREETRKNFTELLSNLRGD